MTNASNLCKANAGASAPIGIFSRSSVFLVSLSLLLLPGCENSATLGTDSGKKAPEITGEDMRGVPITLSQFQGKVVLIDFWATWCGPCRAEMPETRELFRQYDTRPFAILGISRDRKREDLENFLDQEKLPWPNIFDAAGSICDQWRIEGFPTFVLVDHKGFIVERWVGGGQGQDIHDAIDRAVRKAENK